MRHRIPSLLCAVALTSFAASAADAAPAPEPQPTTSDLAGSYYRGDGLRRNITLNLRETGDYTATWHGCITEAGSTEGKWSVSGTVISLNPSRETETTKGLNSMKGQLRELHLLRKDGAFIFVPDLKEPYYLKHGVNPSSAFHRQDPTANR